MKQNIKYIVIGAVGYAVVSAVTKYALNNTQLGRTVKETVQSQISSISGIFKVATNAAEQALEQQKEETEKA